MSALDAMPESRLVAVALGSNLGDRAAHLRHAVTRLRQTLTGLRVSTFMETEPEGVSPQPAFLNGAVVGESAGRPFDLLGILQDLEGERQRARPFPGAARTLDLDLILVGDCVESSARIALPHPRFRERLFVLRPLAEIAPEMIDPLTGQSITTLLERAARRR